MTVAYVSAKPSKYMSILYKRNSIHNVVDEGHYHRKQKPHITLVPPFKIKPDTKQDIKEEVSELDIKGCELVDKGLSVHESPEKPFALYIETDVEELNKVEEMRDRLQQYSSVPITEPSDPHISLFKTRGYWDSVPDSMVEKIENEIEFYNPLRDIEVDQVKLRFSR